jgi:DNA-binding MarR family transcriptional regulator
VADASIVASAVLGTFCNPLRFRLLLYVCRFPGLALKDLAALIECHPSTATVYIQALAAAGWVKHVRAGKRKLVYPSSPQHAAIIEAIDLLVRRVEGLADADDASSECTQERRSPTEPAGLLAASESAVFGSRLCEAPRHQAVGHDDFGAKLSHAEMKDPFCRSRTFTR